ncbi:MAG: 2-dehydropantoate 2-reductase [Anaerolineaceae bacterium]|jgi:2-dehydropantoate 2-reductase|nr:2-dehydropantoate 2-reductase [Anaerolineaceae bacterium]
MAKESLPEMKFLVIGAGAIGTYIGGSLALSGQSVVFLERPEMAKTLRERGLCLNIGGNEQCVRAPQIVSSVDEALTRGPYDVGILAVKSYDTPALMDMLRPYAVALPPFLSFQNGVENEMSLTEVLGEEKVIPGTLTSAIGRKGAGDIVLERLRGIGIAETHLLTAPLVSVLDAAGLNAVKYARADSMKWSKLLTNLWANATSAILDMSPTEIYAHPGLCRLELVMEREALRVMRALHIPVCDLPGTPVRLMAGVIRFLPDFVSAPLLQPVIGKARGDKMPSFHIDLYSGRGKSEVAYLNGAVVRFGEAAGVATPVNHLLMETLTGLTEGEIPLETYARKPDKLLARLKK